jgi:serine/threonine protein kinase/sugar lactone lactonase YvrE
MDIEVRDQDHETGNDGRPSTSGPGFTVPGYTILDELGRGGCAVVYQARQEMFGRVVALKLLTRLLDDGLVRRFERERRALGALASHPNIVVVHDAGFTPTGEAFFAMELMAGGSLSDHLDLRGPLAVADALSAGVAVADALAAAHGAGLLHRDVKPGNVLVDHLGVCKLSDFGIAAFQADAGSVTGGMAGTVAHTAPEVLSGQPASVVSDVYSLGSTLHTLLSGEAPFVRGTDESFLASALRAWTEPAPDLRERGVPDALASLVEVTMAKTPEGRPATAAAVATALRDCQRTLGLPVSSSPIGAGVAVEAAAVTIRVARGGDTDTRDSNRTAWSATPTPTTPPTTPTTPTTPPAATTTTGERGRDTDGRRQEDTSVLAVRVPWLPIPAPSDGSTGVPDDGAHADAATDNEIARPSRPARPARSGRRTGAVVVGGVAIAAAAAFALTLLVLSATGDDRPSRSTAGATTGATTGATVAAADRVLVAGTVATGAPATATAPTVPATVPEATTPVTETPVTEPPVTAPSGPRVVATIPVGDGAVGIDGDASMVWVTVNDPPRLVGLDAATRTVARTVPLPTAPEGVAVTPDAVWVTDFQEGVVWRIDPATGAVVATIEVEFGPTDLTVTDRGVFVTLLTGQAIVRIDPATNTVAQTIRTPEPMNVIQADAHGDLWVAGLSGTVRRVGPDGRFGRALDLPGPATGVAAGFDAVWVAAAVADDQGRVLRIDPATGQVTATLTVGTSPNGLAVGAGGVWVTGTADDTVWRIDPIPDRPQVRGTVDVAGAPLGIATTDDAVWVAVRDGGAVVVIAQ